MVDGTVFTGPWGRPQNDGPALRVLAFAAYIKQYGLNDLARTWYTSNFPANSIIKSDLEFVASQWSYQCFDLWEEVRATHLYTRLVQQSALQAGAEIATAFNDPGAASYYRKVAGQIQADMNRFWDAPNNFLRYAIEISGDRGKYSNLDTAVILGCLHSRDYPDPNLPCYSDRIMVTAGKILASFQNLYKINGGAQYALLGRYQEDIYDGIGTSQGNPWILTTHGFAEYLYTIAAKLNKELANGWTVTPGAYDLFSRVIPGVVSGPGPLTAQVQQYVIGNLTVAGDGFMSQVYKYANNGSFPEEIDRNTGQLHGARELTWSHGSFLTALQMRASITGY